MSGPIQNGFQGVVNNQPGVAEAGDFTGVNPRAVLLAGPARFVAPAGGLTVGNFAWADGDTGAVSQEYVPGDQIGFLHRDNQAVITNFLAPATMIVNEGFPITLFAQGDFWGKFDGGATPGDKVYANPADGSLIASATAPTITSVTADAGFTGTAAMGASFTGVISTNVLTTSAVTGYITAGDVLAGAGITVGTVIGAQTGGTPGGAGTYSVTHADVSSEAMTSTSNLLHVTATVRGALVVGSVVTGGTIAGGSTVTAVGAGFYTISGAKQTVASGTKAADTTTLNVSAVASGVLAAGDVIAGSGVTSGTQIVAQLTGSAGGVGTYQISVAQNFASTAVTIGGILTPWIVNSVAAAGELAKISTWG